VLKKVKMECPLIAIFLPPFNPACNSGDDPEAGVVVGGAVGARDVARDVCHARVLKLVTGRTAGGAVEKVFHSNSQLRELEQAEDGQEI
jgi:hypothetical protein